MREKLKSLDRNIIVLVLAAVLVVGGVVYSGSKDDDVATEQTATAQEANEESQESQDEQAQENGEARDSADDESAASENEADGEAADYSYVAQPGDSYTEMARKAVQTYGLLNDVQLTPAQIVYAETVLTQSANAPLLNVGEEVSFAEEDLQSTVEQAADLSDEAEAQWDYYAQTVDFNTDHVGEARE